MITDRKIIRLLILEDSQNEAARIVSLFRNAGHATRAQRIASLDDLHLALNNTWDLCIAASHCQQLTPSVALQTIQRTFRDIAFIQLTESADATHLTAALKQGAHNALAQGEDELLILVANQELANLSARRARREAEVTLRETEKRCQLLLESSVDAIAYVHDGMHVYASHAYLKLFGYQDAEILEGIPIIDLIASKDQERFREFLSSYPNADADSSLTCTGVTTTHDHFPAHMSFSAAQYDGEQCIQVLIRGTNHCAELEQKLRELRSQDQVTGLYNRQYFLQLLDSAVERSINNHQANSLAYIKIDNYSSLEADLGVTGIDLFLAELAQKLQQELSADAQLARFADDAFCVLAPDTTPQQHKTELLNLSKHVDAHLFEIKGRTAHTTLSIGVAILNDKTSKPAKILARAQRCAEQLPQGNALKIHDPADDLAAAANRGDIIAMVQQALDSNNFKLLFQPIISLRGEDNELYEVLLRLVSPQGEEVAPADFLNAAITAGLADKIDRWVLFNSIKLLSEHRNKGHQTRFFIHLSSASLQDPSLLPWLKTTLEAAALPAEAIILQVREVDAVTYLKQAKQLSNGLREMGCLIALGQFGCALNPFNTLKHLDAQFVKVDSSFSKELNTDTEQKALKGMLTELHAQNRQSIIPAVESASILSTLWQAGVHYIQGYYLQGPSQAMSYDFSSHDI